MSSVGAATQTTAFGPGDRTTWSAERVTHLRKWALDDEHALDPTREEVRLGSSSKCTWRLRDRSRQLSGINAVLTPVDHSWQIEDPGSRNGLVIDGALVLRATPLQPGAILKLGGLTLVAESPSFRALRALVRRVLGWAPARMGIVDDAVQSLRDFATLRTPLTLHGHEDLLPIAERLHRATLGPHAGLHVFRHGELAAAVDAAGEGTLCLPAATSEMIDGFFELVGNRQTGVPRLLCCKKMKASAESSVVPVRDGRQSAISIPTLSTRRDEVPRIRDEVIADVLEQEGLRAHRLRAPQLERLISEQFKYLTDLEDSIYRLVLVRHRGITQAAKKLKRSHSTISDWASDWLPKASTPNLDQSYKK